MSISTIGGINRLPAAEKRAIYARLIPPALLNRFQLNETLHDAAGVDLLQLECSPGSTSVEMALFHQTGFPDPVLYGHLSDRMNGQLHILLYILNDPDSPRFDVDRMPDGSVTKFGTVRRNLAAEQAAMQAGRAPGQVRAGMRLLPAAIAAFEQFVTSLGHDMYFVEPLYYHNAVIFERYGLAYVQGRRLMNRIQEGFSDGGDLRPLLNGSTAFRQAAAADSIRLRSWAIHDGLLGEPFTDVTMYKRVGQSAGIRTTADCPW